MYGMTVKSVLSLMLFLTTLTACTVGDTARAGPDIITLYHEGDRIVFSAAHPYFLKISRSCAEILAHSFPVYPAPDVLVGPVRDTGPGGVVDSIISEEWAIEITYLRRRPAFDEIGFCRNMARLFSFYRFIIPLTGPLARIDGGEEVFAAVFYEERLPVTPGGHWAPDMGTYADAPPAAFGAREGIDRLLEVLAELGFVHPVR